VGTNTGANKERLEGALRAQLTPSELPNTAPLYITQEALAAAAAAPTASSS